MNVRGNRRIFLDFSLSLQPVEGGEIGGKRKVVKRDVRGVLIYSNEQGRIMKERGKKREKEGKREMGGWLFRCANLSSHDLPIFSCVYLTRISRHYGRQKRCCRNWRKGGEKSEKKKLAICGYAIKKQFYADL